jgi:putative ABC transport system permease protein
VVTGDRERSLRILYDDIEGDRRFYQVFSALILAGAAFAAFNLTGRIVTALRREVGIGMALGVPPARLALRPLGVAAQVALLGALAGIGVGALVSRLMAGVLSGLLFLPRWRYPADVALWVRGVVLGVAVPFVAAALPVRRMLRLTPVEAIRTAPPEVGGRGPGSLRWLHLPGGTLAQMPVRNTVRTPRRTLLTAAGIAAAITVLVGVLGMVDSFDATIARGEAELLRRSPRRVIVQLEGFLPAREVRARLADPTVAVVEPHLRLPVTVRRGSVSLDVFVDVLPDRGALWRPRLRDPHRAGRRPGIVLTRRAAETLGVRPGGTLRLRHPRREGTGYRFVTTAVTLRGVTDLPLRPVAFMDAGDARIMNLTGIANAAAVQPAAGVPAEQVQRALFGRRGVGTVEPAARITADIRRELDRVLGLLVIVQGAVLVLTLLIAFNSAGITVDERRREHATMFAFGVPVSAVLAVTMVESLLVGTAGTVAGIVAGRVLVGQLIERVVAGTFPDLGLVADVSTATVGLALGLGTVAVAAAPLLLVRRLRGMDVPATLRVVE